jgi:GH35 family endo-1,4-beta-xylanase
VVNEPTHLGRFNTRLGEWAVSLGPVPYVTEHLEIARAANPNATLLVNDYRTDPAYYQILDALRDGGRLRFDVVGIQSHMHGGGWPLRRIWEVCDTYGRLGLPLHFTETTIVSGPRRDRDTWGETTAEGERRQAEYVSKFYTMLFAHPAVQALIWWDLSDHGAWQRAPAGWLRKDMSPKPVYDVLLELIRGKWWTKTQGQTDAAGTFAWRAFHGRHLLRVQALNGPTRELEITVEPGRPNRFELVLP